MLIIKKLSGMIMEEIHDAEKYAQCALDNKGTDKTLADTFYTLSTEELKHMEALHGQVTRKIKEYRDAEGEPPADMLAVYNYIHEEQIEAVRKVKIMLGMYKEG